MHEPTAHPAASPTGAATRLRSAGAAGAADRTIGRSRRNGRQIRGNRAGPGQPVADALPDAGYWAKNC
ncbi:MAG TPA: hypothetical protein DDZ76_02215, partial [Xanthomonadales bacterium]|nr:hypothetical protein [Xanthomonadales bacterium]